MKTGFLKLIAIALLHIPFQSFAQQAEFGVFWGKNYNLANEQQHSKIVGEFDKLFGVNHINDGGGIQAAWYFTENLGIRAGYRFNNGKYNLDIHKPIYPYFGDKYYFIITDNFQQVPLGLVWRMPVFNNSRTLKLFSDINLDIHKLHGRFDKGEVNHFEDAAEINRALLNLDIVFHNTIKQNYKLGGTIGLGVTPFNCKQLELNLCYSHSFSELKAISYKSDLTYFNQDEEEFKVPSHGSIYIKPSSFSAQLVFYLYQK
jgi:hypothetical protein